MEHKIRNENGGFTLVELIITMAVLAVISVPLLKYFSDSMRHNVRMKEQQNAVVAAQNVLEDLKVADVNLDDISNLTTASTAAPGATPAPTMTVDWSAYATAAPGSSTYEVKGNYLLNGSSYSVKAKITPRQSLTNDTGTVKTYSKVEVPTMDSSKDMVATETKSVLENAKGYFEGIYAKYCDDHSLTRNPQCTVDYFAQFLEREIHLTLEQNSTETDKIDISISYEYTCSVGSEPILAAAKTTLEAEKWEELIKKVTLPNTGEHNIFLFYTPINYRLVSGGATPGPTATSSPATPPIVVSDTVRLYGDLTGAGTAGTGTGQLSYKLYLIADGTVERSNAKSGTYKLTLDTQTGSNVNDFVSDVFTDLSSAELNSGGFSINNSTFSLAAGHGIHTDTLLTSSNANRIAEIEVSVYRGDSVDAANLYTTVNGTKIQKQ